MNGRAYDYNLGRFLSVDPFIQAPSSTQSINPYSYIMNNPLAGTDPTGYMGKCDQNPTCQMQSFFSSVGSGGSSLIGNLMGRLKTTLSNGHDAKQAKKTQEPKAAAAVNSPAAVSFVLDRSKGGGDKSRKPPFRSKQSDTPLENVGIPLGVAADLTPVVGDIKGIVEAIEDPTAINVVAAGVGLIPGIGDAAAIALKETKNIRNAGGGAARAAKHSSNWVTANLSDAVEKFGGSNAVISTTSSGKRIYTNQSTGIQIVEDLNGGYFRIHNPSIVGKRSYLDLNGNIPNNKTLDNGKQVGRSQGEYNQVTHFKISE